MNIFRTTVTLILLALLTWNSRSLTNPAPSDLTQSYKRQYEEITEEGSIPEYEVDYLKKKEQEYLNSPEREARANKSIGYKFLLAIGLLFVSFFGLKGVRPRYIVVSATILVVGFSGLLVTSVFESFVYTLFAMSGAFFGTKYNKPR
ncbi:hypothetical protein [Neptunicella sp. SCSIO 80796]|uniref:hypothetical protein n=1 Tax=Neptunicella plasticusilytica TaxID=3117012 RepID=UPI003A4DA1A6